MPNYTYKCDTCEDEETRFMTIAEMETFEAKQPVCACGGAYVHQLRVGRPIVFREGFFEHVSEHGAYCSSMDELKKAAYHGGTYSQYVKDLGGAFPGSKEGRWI
jgi:hypothetical protein